MVDAAHNALPAVRAASVPRRDALAGIAALAVSMRGSPRRVAAGEPAPLRIGGTGMALAAMRQIGDAFTAAQPQTTVTVLPSLGTGGGLAAVAAGAIDVAVAARATERRGTCQGPAMFLLRTDTDGLRHPSRCRCRRRDAGGGGRDPGRSAARVAERNGNPTDPAGTLGRGLVPAADLVSRNGGRRAGCAGAARSAHAGDRPGKCGRARTAARFIRSHVDRPDCAPNPAASPRSCWMVNRRRSRHWPADATHCRALCMSPRAASRPRRSRGSSPSCRAGQTGELLTRLGHIPLAGTGT